MQRVGPAEQHVDPFGIRVRLANILPLGVEENRIAVDIGLCFPVNDGRQRGATGIGRGRAVEVGVLELVVHTIRAKEPVGVAGIIPELRRHQDSRFCDIRVTIELLGKSLDKLLPRLYDTVICHK